MINKIFLGGTCANSTWRNELIPLLNVEYFNPVVADWTPECQEEEENQKNNLCNVHLYVISKEMEGVFSIAEAVDSSSTLGIVTVVQILPDGFENHQLKSLKATVSLLQRNGAIAFIDNDINRLGIFLNAAFTEQWNR